MKFLKKVEIKGLNSLAADFPGAGRITGCVVSRDPLNILVRVPIFLDLHRANPGLWLDP
ncbi:MAG: hypothetical protein ACWA5K_03420 [bacterium]